MSPMHWDFFKPITDPVTYWEEVTGLDANAYLETHEVSPVEGLPPRLRRWLHDLHRLPTAQWSGIQRSLFKGLGLEFSQLREYIPGDDIRKLDWNVFARTGVPHVKEYQEERQIEVWFVMDCSASMGGITPNSKGEQALRWVSLLATLMTQGGHRIGAYLYHGNEDLPGIIRPQKASHLHLARIVEWAQQAMTLSPLPEETTPNTLAHKAISTLARILPPHRTVLFWLSDFWGWQEEAQLAYGNLSQQVALLSILISREDECRLPDTAGIWAFQDPESAKVFEVDLSTPKLRAQVLQHWLDYYGTLQSFLSSCGPVLTSQASPHREVSSEEHCHQFLQAFQHAAWAYHRQGRRRAC